MSQAGAIRIGISACLLGQEVRFDGGHKRDTFLAQTFGQFVEWVPVCPEVEAGFGTPREAMRLVQQPVGVRLLTVKTGIDVTDRLDRFSTRRVRALRREGLCGYILKKNSPSCGMARVKVYGSRRIPTRSGRGRFAAALQDRLPHLPVEEEGRLSDPRLRDNFVERIFAYRRLRALFAARWTVGGLVRFHIAHKLVLMAHSVEGYRRLGVCLAKAKSIARAQVEGAYTEAFMTALTVIATPRRHAAVLTHVAGYFKTLLTPADKDELRAAIEDYRRGLVPLVVPVTLVRHHVRQHDVAHLRGQVYLDPHPTELMLRNHV